MFVEQVTLLEEVQASKCRPLEYISASVDHAGLLAQWATLGRLSFTYSEAMSQVRSIKPRGLTGYSGYEERTEQLLLEVSFRKKNWEDPLVVPPVVRTLSGSTAELFFEKGMYP